MADFYEARKQEAKSKGMTFENFLREIGHFVPISPDGNCLYSAILYYVRSNVIKDQQRVRDLIANEIEINADMYKDWIALDSENDMAPGDETAADVSEKVAEIRGTAFGNAICINAASRVFNRNFNVISWEGANSRYPDHPIPNRPTHWLAFHGVHYDVVDITQPPAQVSSVSTPMEIDQSLNDQNLIERDGYRAFAAKGHAKGRDKMYIVFLVPKSCEKDTLYESMMTARESQEIVFYGISYGYFERDMYIADRFVCENFTVFMSAIRLPVQETMQDLKKWKFYVVAIHLFMSTLKQTWNGVRIEFLVCYYGNSLIPAFIHSGWNLHSHRVRQAMIRLTSARNGLFCEQCDRDCDLCDEVWHINLEHFSKEKQIVKEGVSIFERRILFSSLTEPDQKWGDIFKYLYCMHHIYLTDNFKTNMRDLLDIVDMLAEHGSGKYYCSYLLLLIDGPGMSTGIKFRDIANNDAYKKSVYAGCTTSQRFRMSHVTKILAYEISSLVRRLLTKTSQLYLIRSKIFDSFTDARIDESKMIEILKETLARSLVMKKRVPYMLLNKGSESATLLKLSSSEIAKVLDFIDSGTPIFIPGNENENFSRMDAMPDPLPEVDGKFRGNLVVTRPLFNGFNVDETFEDRLPEYAGIFKANTQFRFLKAKSIKPLQAENV